MRPRLGAARDRLRGRRRGAVVALSGLDGAGKSTQAEALRDALERLGFAVAVEWTRIGSESSLGAVPRPLRATAMTIDQLWRQRRRIGGWLARDFVVVCDRYTLDSIVSLRCVAGERRRLRLQRLALRALARRPAAAFLLDVPAETAWRRKGEQGLESLRRQQALYHAEHSRLGVVRLDGERAPDELAARIAREAFAALGPR